MTIPAGLQRFQRSIVSKRNASCDYCGAATFAGTDFAVLTTDGKWIGVCYAHAVSVTEQVKALVLKVQAEASGLNEAQTAAIDAHCPADIAEVLAGTASGARTLSAAQALDSAVRVARLFKAESAPAPVRSNRYPGKCGTCGQGVGEGTGRIERNDAGKWLTFHLDGQCPTPDVAFEAISVGIDLTPLKAFTSKGICRFGVPGVDTRLKLSVKFKSNGDIYVDDAAVYGHGAFYGRQVAGQSYRGKVEAELTAILADPQAAVVKYAKLTDRCGVCNLHLEDEESIARGMGPVCAAKFG